MANDSAANSNASKSMLWMTVALFVGMAVMLGGGLFFAGRVIRTAGLGAANDGNTFHTPLGSLRLEKQKQVGPGLPLYPHVELVLPAQDEALKAAREAHNGIMRTGYRTEDLEASVEKWYMEHLPPEFKRRGPGEAVMPEIFSELKIPDSSVAFIAQRNGQVRVVVLAEDQRGVQISLIKMDRGEKSGEKPAKQSAPGGPAAPAQQPASTEQAPAQQQP